MRKLYFLLPGTTGKFICGGLFAELRLFHLAKELCDAEIVTYRQREKDTLFLDDLLQQSPIQDAIFVLSWGFDVPKLAARLKNLNVIYHAHSAGYGFRLPPSIPIITVSRNSMSYWGQQAASSLIYYLPNQIGDEFQNLHLEREIDVLVQTRKSSHYLLKQLIPALQKHCRVTVIDKFVEDLPDLFNRAKVYLYDSAEYWAQQGVTEGFGLQPMEAIACGCTVFSSINHALADYLDPGFNCYKIAAYSSEYDGQRILQVLQNPSLPALPDDFLSAYRKDAIIQRFQVILQEINQFFDRRSQYTADIPALTPGRLTRLRFTRLMDKINQKLLRRK